MNVRSYFRHVLVVLTGTGAAQVINLAAYPVLTRLYSPQDFGSFALFLSVVGIVGPVACARLDMAILTAPDWQLSTVYRRALSLNGLTALAVTATSLAYATLTGSFDLVVVALIGAGVFLTGYTLAVRGLLIRLERFELSSRSMVIRAAVSGLAQIGLWFVLPGALSLILGFCIGFAVEAMVLRRGLSDVRIRRATASQGRAVLARYRNQILTDIPGTILGGMVLNVMSFLLLDLYSRGDVGFYALAFRVGVLPLALISGSLSQVFFQRASAAYRETGTFWPQLRFNLLASAGLSLLVFAPFVVLARPLFAFVFGDEWVAAADMLLLLLPMLAVRFVSSTIQTAPLVVGRANWLLVQHAALILAIAAAYGTAGALGLPIGTYLLLTAILMALVYGGFIGFVAHRVRHRYGGPVVAPAQG